MRTNNQILYALTIGLASLMLVVGCGEKKVEGTCNRDADCGPGFMCSADHICLCTDDTACGADQFCNSSGYCQKYLGCRVDADCGAEADWRCEISQEGDGQCLCQTDAACSDGEFCNTSGACQTKAGCILDADCGSAVDWRCRINPDTGIGECQCSTDAACEQGEFCNVHGYCQPNSSCDSNDDCPAGRFCNVQAGECLCNPDAQTGCGPNEVCNASGYCQPRPGCYDNSDCADLPDTYCDFNTRTCVPNGQCTSDLQCPLGEICKLDQGSGLYLCTEGCNASSDCPLDQYCSNNVCVAGCQDDGFCGFAEFCMGGGCQSGVTPNTPYCQACDNADSMSCGPIENSCLIYPYENDPFAQANGPDPEYCAPDCSGDQRCPNGFSCSTVITIKNTDLCQTNADCPGGLPCLKSPEEDQGFCPCTQDLRNPCMANTCFSSDVCWLGSCMIAGWPCQANPDCNFCQVTRLPCGAGCPPTDCEIYDGADYGGCVSAKACGLQEGVHCPVQ